MVPPISHKVSRVSWYSGYCRCLPLSNTRLSLSLAGFPKTFLLASDSLMQSMTPERTRSGLGSFPFARRYSGNRCFFLFLRVLRCFSSPGSLPYVMYWRMDDWGLLSRVSPFRYLRLNGYLLLPAAFRSLSRLSSALSAKASTLRPYQLDHIAKTSFRITSLLRKLAIHTTNLIHNQIHSYFLFSLLNDSDSHMVDIALSPYSLVCFL